MQTQWFGRAISPAGFEYDSPPSPSTSDDPANSPPLKRSRYTPPLVAGISDEEFYDDDDDDDDEEDDEDTSNYEDLKEENT